MICIVVRIVLRPLGQAIGGRSSIDGERGPKGGCSPREIFLFLVEKQVRVAHDERDLPGMGRHAVHQRLDLPDAPGEQVRIHGRRSAFHQMPGNASGAARAKSWDGIRCRPHVGPPPDAVLPEVLREWIYSQIVDRLGQLNLLGAETPVLQLLVELHLRHVRRSAVEEQEERYLVAVASKHHRHFLVVATVRDAVPRSLLEPDPVDDRADPAVKCLDQLLGVDGKEAVQVLAVDRQLDFLILLLGHVQGVSAVVVGATLNDSLLEEAAGGWRCEMVDRRLSSRALTKDGHVRAITSEGRDVVANPRHRQLLVLDAEITGTAVRGAALDVCGAQEAEGSEAVVCGGDHHLVARARDERVDRVAVRGALDVRATRRNAGRAPVGNQMPGKNEPVRLHPPSSCITWPRAHIGLLREI